MSGAFSKQARSIEKALERSLRRLDPTKRTQAALAANPPRDVRRLRAIAIGKAAPAMAAALLAPRWRRALVELVVVTTDGTDVSSAIENDPRVELIRAAHPVPDARSVRAAKRCLDVARACAADEEGSSLLLVLVSGGASALVCAPAAGVRLSQKRAVTKAMLASGASIQEINIVRKHLSAIKGGGLARAASPARVMTFAASDVIGGSISDIGSGPSVSDATTITDARRLLRAHVPSDLARSLHDVLAPTGRATNAAAGGQYIILSPQELARVVGEELGRVPRIERVRVLRPSQASVEDMAREYIALAKRLPAGTAIVRAAEPSLVVPASSLHGRSKSRGGRASHLAALVGRELDAKSLFAAIATDGVDGSSGTRGAIVDSSFVDRAGGRSIVDYAIDRFDTGSLHIDAGTALSSCASGHNLADCHVLVIVK